MAAPESTLAIAGILSNSGEVVFDTPSGERIKLALHDIWRSEKVIARLLPADAFRLGIEWQRWSSRAIACQ